MKATKVSNAIDNTPVQKKLSSTGKSLPSAPITQLYGYESEKNEMQPKDGSILQSDKSSFGQADATQGKFIGVKQLKSSPSFPPLQLKNNDRTAPIQMAAPNNIHKIIQKKAISPFQGKEVTQLAAFKYSADEKPEDSVKNIRKNYSSDEGSLGKMEDLYPDVVHGEDDSGHTAVKKVGGDQFVGGRFEENSLGNETSKGFKADKTLTIPVVYHTTGSEWAMENIISKGINPSFTRTDNRFGQGFYVTSDINTSRSELIHHGMQAYHSLKYNSAGGKILDLTHINEDEVFTKDYPQGIRLYALSKGFDGVAYKSQRGAGVNFVIYHNFNSIIGAADLGATKTWTKEERAEMEEEHKTIVDGLDGTLDETKIYSQAGQVHGFSKNNQ